MKRKRYLFIGFAVALGLLVGTALAASPSPSISFVARGTLGPLDAENQGAEVEREGSADHAVVGLTFPPGSSTGWHRHPGVVLVTVASGRIQHIDTDCERETFQAGESFFEEGEIHLARNPGTEDAVVYATWVIPTKAPALTIPEDAPKGCQVQ